MVWNFHDFAHLGPVLQSGAFVESEGSVSRVVIQSSSPPVILFSEGDTGIPER